MSIDLSKMPKLGFGMMRLPQKNRSEEHTSELQSRI